MNRQEIRLKLSRYTNGGNAFLLYDYLLDIKKQIIEISQEELAKELNKTRPAIQSSLSILKKEKLIEFGYGKIKILGENNGK